MDDQILAPENREDFPEDFNKPRPDRMKWLSQNYLMVLAGVMVLILLVVAGLWFLRNKREESPTAPNVVLNIKGPDSMSSGNESEFRVIYVNGENADLSNISLEMFFPSNFKFVSADPKPISANGQRYDLPVLRQGQTGEIKIRGKLTGATGELKELRGRLSYTLSNFNSAFSTDTSFKTTLTAPALEMEITGPIDVTNGQNTTFTVNYKNVSGKEFDATVVELAYPDGFKFASSNPAPTRNQNYWLLGKLPVAGAGKIEITGSFVGDPGSEQQVGGDLGLVLGAGIAPQIHASARFKIQASTLSLTQEYPESGIVKLGERINYTLNYANFGNVGQSNVVIVATLDSPALDLSKITANNGIITGNTITWKSATVSGLGLLTPNQRGELNFSVPVKNTMTTNLKNQTVKLSTLIYSDQITSAIRGQESELKLGSQIEMFVSGQYLSGPLPPKVGETTTFNVSVLVTNLSNDLTSTEMIASMPLPAATWANVIIPDSEKANLTFDANVSKIRWRVGDLAAFVGKFTPARNVTFKLQVTPSEADRGKHITLLKNMQFTATDAFTQQELKSNLIDELTLEDLGDDQIDVRGSNVQ